MPASLLFTCQLCKKPFSTTKVESIDDIKIRQASQQFLVHLSERHKVEYDKFAELLTELKKDVGWLLLMTLANIPDEQEPVLDYYWEIVDTLKDVLEMDYDYEVEDTIPGSTSYYAESHRIQVKKVGQQPVQVQIEDLTPAKQEKVKLDQLITDLEQIPGDYQTASIIELTMKLKTTSAYIAEEIASRESQGEQEN